MSLAVQVTPSAGAQASAGRRVPWLQPASLALLTLWLYAGILTRLMKQWWSDPNFSHGFLVPLFSVFLLWRDRARLRNLTAAPSYWGLPLIASAMVMLLLGSMGAEIFLARLSLILLILGMIVLFGGWNYAVAVGFPLGFLLLMIPIPAIVLNQVTLPLQLFASRTAAAALPWLGVPVFRQGNVIDLPAKAMEVAEACSGIRSLMSLITLSVIYGFLLERRLGLRLLLAAAAIPIAVCANAVRIVGTGLLVQYWSPDKAEGFLHVFSGWLVFLASLIMLFLFHQALVHLPRLSRLPRGF